MYMVKQKNCLNILLSSAIVEDDALLWKHKTDYGGSILNDSFTKRFNPHTDCAMPYYSRHQKFRFGKSLCIAIPFPKA